MCPSQDLLVRKSVILGRLFASIASFVPCGLNFESRARENDPEVSNDGAFGISLIRSALSWLATIFWGCSVAVASDANSDPQSQIIFWETHDSRPSELSEQFNTLYKSLAALRKRGILIPTKTVPDVGERSAEQILRETNQYFGPNFLRATDKFLCDLNPRVCKRVGSKIHWITQSQDALVIPDISFQRVSQIQPYHKSTSVSLSDIVVNIFESCDRWDKTCQEVLLRLNPERPELLEKPVHGWIQVQTIGYRASIPISLSPTSPVLLNWSSTPSERVDDQFTGSSNQRHCLSQPTFLKECIVDPIGERTSEALPQLRLPTPSQNKDTVDEVQSWAADPRGEATLRPQSRTYDITSIKGIKELRELLPANAALVPSSPSKYQTPIWHSESVPAPSREPIGDRSTIFKLINHPFADNHDFVSKNFIEIGLIDQWVYPNHCLMDPARIRILNSVAPDPSILGARATTCGERSSADRIIDHATHLLGLLAARRNAPTGRGVNPDLYIQTLQIDTNSFGNPLYVSRVVEKLVNFLAGEGSPKIFNLSFSYPFIPQPAVDGILSVDNLEQFIRKGGKNRLFVVAGSEALGQPITQSRSCTVRPVCLDSPNVISVAATDLTPRPQCPSLIPQSNHGLGIDVAAPGMNIVSAIAENKTGMLSGSSQAAPLVAGTLSLLFGKDEVLLPLVAKNRIIYTADMCVSLDVLGGRLNVARALDFEHAALRLDGRDQLRTGIIRNRGLVVNFTDKETHVAFKAQLFSIKRLYRLPDGYYILLFRP